MKTLVLVRHAKSSWKNAHLTDIDRPLNKRGKRDAPMMGRRVAAGADGTDALISSPALRARATAQAFAEALGKSGDDVRLDERLYGASVAGLLRFVQALDDELDRVMIFGHNPTFTEFANLFDVPRIDNVPTCGVVTFRFDVDSWSLLDSTTAARMDFDYPKKEQDS